MINRRTFLTRAAAAGAVVIAAPLIPVVAAEVPVIDVVPHFAYPEYPLYCGGYGDFHIDHIWQSIDAKELYQKIWLGKAPDTL